MSFTSWLDLAMGYHGATVDDLIYTNPGDDHAFDPIPARTRRGGRYWKTSPGPRLADLDAPRIQELVAGAMPTEEEAATLAELLGGFRRGFFTQADPPPEMSAPFFCDLHDPCDCGEPSAVLCDFAFPDGRTCDAPMCDACAFEAGEDRHLCSAHRPGVKVRPARRVHR